MRIAVGSDHAGFRLKSIISAFLTEWGHEVADFGCHDTASVDYPDIAQAVGLAVVSGQCGRGVLICSNGVGMSIAANKVPGIRAALCHDIFSARRSREHNDANVLCLGEWVVGRGVAQELLWAFLSAEFLKDQERHARRVGKLEALDQVYATAESSSPEGPGGPSRTV